MASARSASLNGGLGPQPGPGAEPLLGCQRSGGEAPKLKAFCTFLYKKWPKVKDLSENLPPCLSCATVTSPKFWSIGGGGGAAARTAHSWIRHCALFTDKDFSVSFCMHKYI